MATSDNPRASASFTLLCLGVWLHSADTLVTATIAPSLVEDLGGIAYINWTISLYEVGAILAGAAAGVVGTRFGIKRVFIGATLVYGAGCVLAAISFNMAVLIGGRFIQGVGGGMLMALCYVAVEAWFAPPRWGRLFGWVALTWGAGSLLGPLLGSVFAGHHTWRYAFVTFAAQAMLLTLLGCALFPTVTPHEKKSAGRWPIVPLLLLSAATLIIAIAGATHGPLLAVIGCVTGIVLLYAAARCDRRAEIRLMPAELLSLRHPVGTGLAMVFAFSVATTGFWAYGPVILKIVFATKPVVTGYILAGEALAWSLATLVAASARESAERVLIRAGMSAVAAGSAGFALAVPAGSLAGMVVCGLLQGAGFGLCWPAIVQRIVRVADPTERALASASVSTIQRIGYAVGSAAVGVAANLSGLAEGVSIQAAKTAGFWVFAAFIPILVLGMGCTWLFTRDRSTAHCRQRRPSMGAAASHLGSGACQSDRLR
jgi:MFS family permease